MSVHQVRAASVGSAPTSSLSRPPGGSTLETDELTILSSWAEAVAEALVFAPQRVKVVTAEAHAGAAWRGALGVPQPSPHLDRAIDYIEQAVGTAATAGNGIPTPAAVLTALSANAGEEAVDRLSRRVLRSALEQRQARKALNDDLLAHSAPT
jgi:hypothetical protein